VNINRLKAQLIKDEGEVLHAYEDSEGFLTIGIGRLIDKRRGGGLSRTEARYLLDNDIQRVVASLDRSLPWWNNLPESQQQGLANMAFQLGVNGLLGFQRMLAALKRGEYAEARREALDSRWARQTPNRARRVADQIGDMQ
jgi:lysozyme